MVNFKNIEKQIRDRIEKWGQTVELVAPESETTNAWGRKVKNYAAPVQTKAIFDTEVANWAPFVTGRLEEGEVIILLPSQSQPEPEFRIFLGQVGYRVTRVQKVAPQDVVVGYLVIGERQ